MTIFTHRVFGVQQRVRIPDESARYWMVTAMGHEDRGAYLVEKAKWHCGGRA